MPESDPLYLCWTTAPSREIAEALASGIIERQLAACVQIDAPITSFYRWEGKVEQDVEHRVWIKALLGQVPELERFVHEQHPYDTPQWVCLKAEKCSQKYLKWANEVSNLRGFI